MKRATKSAELRGSAASHVAPARRAALAATLAMLAIATKDLRLLARDRVALFWVTGFPLLFACFLGAVLQAGLEGHTAPLRVAWVDESAGHAEVLRSALSRAGVVLEASSLAAARERVRTARAVALVRVPSDFGGGAALELGRDPAHPIEANLLAQTLRAGLLGSGSQGPALHTFDVSPRTHPARAGTLVLPAMILWGLLACSATFAVSLVSERSAGTLLRLRAAPSPRAAILAGKALACFAACLLDAAVLSAIATLVLGVALPAPGKWLLALGCAAWCFTGVSVALSVLGKSEQAVSGAGWAVLLVLAMLGGAMVPTAFLPPWLVQVGNFSPVRWSMLALEGALVRGFSWRELLPTLLQLLGMGAASFAAGVSMLVRQDN